MKKLILLIAAVSFFATGFKGGCIFDLTEFSEEQHSLLHGLRYFFQDTKFEYYNVMCGDNGMIHTNVDPATDFWIPRNSGTENNLNYLANSPDVTLPVIYCVGDNGTILRSLNTGTDWEPLISPTTVNLNSVLLTDVNTIYITGDSGVIIKSTDAGTNWINLNETRSTAENLNSVYASGPFEVIVVGDKGTILKSTTGGSSWIDYSIEDTTVNLNKITTMGTWFFGIILGIAGDNGSVYRSTNHLSWDPVITGTGNNLYDMYFKNASSGFVTGEEGTALYTTDGGVSWATNFFLQSLTTDKISSATQLKDSMYAGVAGSTFIIFTADGSTLPVELMSFNSNVTKNDVRLNWATSSELNSSGFEVERSSSYDQWNKIGFVNGNGNSNEIQNYSFTDKNLAAGRYSYRLKQVDFNGNFEYFNLSNEVIIGQPEKFYLSQNYPNPFNPETKIDYEIKSDGIVKLGLFDISGKEVMMLVNSNQPAGYYTVSVRADNISSGVYFYKLFFTSPGNGVVSETKRMIILK